MKKENNMKKLFISCPMRGRTEENIKKSMEKMHKIAEIIFDQELEVIPSYFEEGPPDTNDARLWYLGRSIQRMAEADFYIGVAHSHGFSGCYVENNVASEYDIPRTSVDIREIAPDVSGMDMIPVTSY